MFAREIPIIDRLNKWLQCKQAKQIKKPWKRYIFCKECNFNSPVLLFKSLLTCAFNNLKYLANILFSHYSSNVLFLRRIQFKESLKNERNIGDIKVRVHLIKASVTTETLTIILDSLCITERSYSFVSLFFALAIVCIIETQPRMVEYIWPAVNADSVTLSTIRTTRCTPEPAIYLSHESSLPININDSTRNKPIALIALMTQSVFDIYDSRSERMYFIIVYVIINRTHRRELSVREDPNLMKIAALWDLSLDNLLRLKSYSGISFNQLIRILMLAYWSFRYVLWSRKMLKTFCDKVGSRTREPSGSGVFYESRMLGPSMQSCVLCRCKSAGVLQRWQNLGSLMAAVRACQKLFPMQYVHQNWWNKNNECAMFSSGRLTNLIDMFP